MIESCVCEENRCRSPLFYSGGILLPHTQSLSLSYHRTHTVHTVHTQKAKEHNSMSGSGCLFSSRLCLSLRVCERTFLFCRSSLMDEFPPLSSRSTSTPSVFPLSSMSIDSPKRPYPLSSSAAIRRPEGDATPSVSRSTRSPSVRHQRTRFPGGLCLYLFSLFSFLCHSFFFGAFFFFFVFIGMVFFLSLGGCMCVPALPILFFLILGFCFCFFFLSFPFLFLVGCL